MNRAWELMSYNIKELKVNDVAQFGNKYVNFAYQKLCSLDSWPPFHHFSLTKYAKNNVGVLCHTCTQLVIRRP